MIKYTQYNNPILKKFTHIIATGFLLISFTTNPSHAANPNTNPGSLDADFGDNGIVNLAEPIAGSACYRASATDILDDGRILAVTTCPNRLLSYLSDGGLDTAFGAGAGYVSAGSIGVQTQVDNKIVTASMVSVGWPRQGFAVQRNHPDGSIDTTFGNNGIAIVEFDAKSTVPSQWGYDVTTTALTLQADGKIVIVGNYNYYNYNGYTHNRRAIGIALARFNADGSLDASFGDQGMLITDVYSATDPNSNPRENVNVVLAQADGTLLIAGSAEVGVSFDFSLLRYNNDGTLDNTFGNGGVVITDIGGNEQIRDIALQADGRIVAAGTNNADFVVARYDSNGLLDAGFGIGGIVFTDFNGLTDNARTLAIQTDGSIVVAGDATRSIRIKGQDLNDTVIALARYNNAGSLDSSFGDNGKVTTVLDNITGESIADIALQPDGKIGGVGAVILRYHP